MLKKQVRDILTPEVIGVSPETRVSEAIKLMETHAISCILILEEQKPVGIFTERNIVEYTVQQGLDFAKRQIRELMSSPVLSAAGDMYIYEAFNLLVTNNIRHLVVVDDQNRAIGVVTQSNMLEHLGYEYFLEIKKVSKIMTKTLCTIPGDYTVYQALTEMAKKTISCVIIVEDDRPLGILTERDVGRLVTRNCDIDRVKVEEVMISPVQSVMQDTPLYEVSWIMRQKNIRRLIVVDRDGKIIGLSTQSDIIKGLEGKYVEILKQIIKEQHVALQDVSEELYEKTVYLDNMLRSSIDMGVIATDVDFRIAYYNPAAEEILYYRGEDVIGCDVREIHTLENVELSRFNAVIETVRQKKRHLFSFERKSKTNTTRYLQGAVTGIWDAEDKLIGFVLMIQDITEHKKAEQTIQYMAYHDSLTDLPNRVLFNERLALELSHAERNTLHLAVMVIDIDFFKDVNDTMGHHAGDILLTSVAARIKNLLRKSDTVARVGGDEFILILPKIQDTKHAVNIAEKILKAFETPFDIENQELPISISIGISVYPFHGKDAESLIKAADHAMYRAKEKNRSNFKSNIHLAPLS